MEWRDVARLRQGLYRFFAGALLPPDGDRIAALQEAIPLLEGLGIYSFAFAYPWHTFAEALRSIRDVDALSSDYVRLFEVGVGGVSVPLFESAYRVDPRTGTTPDLLVALRRRYADLGLEPETGLTGGIDHISVELEAMAALCARETEAWTRHDIDRAQETVRREAAFLNDHPGAWVPQAARRMRTETGHPLYIAAGDALHAFAHHDAELLTLLLEAA